MTTWQLTPAALGKAAPGRKETQRNRLSDFRRRFLKAGRKLASEIFVTVAFRVRDVVKLAVDCFVDC
jgi:hypothetical protein